MVVKVTARKKIPESGTTDIRLPSYLPHVLTSRLKWFIAVLALFGTVHFALTTVYSFQYLPVPSGVREASQTYTVPFFHQNWKLFAPEVPAYDNQLEYRYAANGTWSAWSDVSGSLGYAPHGKIEYIEQVITGVLAWQIANNLYQRNQRMQFDRIVQSFDYRRALYFTKQLHEQTTGQTSGDSLQLRVKFRFTPPPDKAYTFQSSYLEFPVYPFNHAKQN